MHSAIVAIEMPKEDEKWLAFLNTTGDLTKRHSFQTLAANVWQIDFQSSPGDFAHLVAAAVRHGLAYKILPFDAAPQWLPAR
jgi:hypothetical protein